MCPPRALRGRVSSCCFSLVSYRIRYSERSPWFWCDLAALLPYIVMCMHCVRSAVRSGRGCVDQSQSFWWWGLSVGVVSIRRLRSRVNSGVSGSGCVCLPSPDVRSIYKI